MGKEGRKAATPTASPKSQAEKRASREPAKEEEEESAARMMKKKKKSQGGGDPKAGPGEDAVHTCWGCRFPLLAALLQLALGASVVALGFLLAGASSSSLLVRDTPYWAGILVCVVALLGLVMLCVSYQPDEKNCIQFAVKIAYFLLSALSLMVCVMAVAFAAYRYSQITQFDCEMVPEACQCKLDTEDPLGRTFLFKNVSDCTAITGTFRNYLLIQIALNLLAAIVGFAACFVMWRDRYQVFYVGIWLRSLNISGGQQEKV